VSNAAAEMHRKFTHGAVLDVSLSYAIRLRPDSFAERQLVLLVEEETDAGVELGGGGRKRAVTGGKYRCGGRQDLFQTAA
jgi:urease beta subunit